MLDKRLIEIVGKKEAPGKPILYGTTKEFLQYFGLNSLTELPTLKDLQRERSCIAGLLQSAPNRLILSLGIEDSPSMYASRIAYTAAFFKARQIA